MTYFKQIYYEMQHQKMMTWVSVAGTALAIFLVMTFFMTDQLKVVESAPEVNRSRMLYGGGFDVRNEKEGWSRSGSMSYPMARKLYDNLDGIGEMAFTNAWEWTADLNKKGQVPFSVMGKNTDGNFWKLYSFNFISGKPYDEADMRSGAKKIVLSRSVARKILGKDDAAGETVFLNNVPYLVSGVIEDVNPTMLATFSNIYIPINADDLFPNENNEKGFGSTMVHMLMEDGADVKAIKTQMEERYKRLNDEWKEKGWVATYHGAPHDVKDLATGHIFSNISPDTSKHDRRQFLIYIVLLLIPAINLGCMMRGRLRHRVSEIGVRRAFGAKRRDIVMQILGENFIVTLAGGLIGLVISILFMLFVASYFISLTSVDSSALAYVSSAPEVGMLFTWKSFALALCMCFVLNLLSASLPAWKASREQPSEAISKSKM